MKPTSRVKPNLKDATPEQLEKIDRVLHPRDTILSLRFSKEDIEAWKNAAKRADKSMTEWIEGALEKEAAK